MASGCIDEHDKVKTTQTVLERESMCIALCGGNSDGVAPKKTLWEKGEEKGKAIMAYYWRFERKKKNPLSASSGANDGAVEKHLGIRRLGLNSEI